MTFQVTKHFFDPHSVGVSLQESFADQEGSWPGTKVHLPQLSSAPTSSPDRSWIVSANLSPATYSGQAFPPSSQNHRHVRLPKKTNMRTTFLAQNIVPMPTFQLFQHFHRPKFAVANQQNGDSSGQKASDIRQQSQLGIRCAMPFSMLDPCPGNRDGAFPISQTDDQQLMCKTNFGPIHNQPYLLKMFWLAFPTNCAQLAHTMFRTFTIGLARNRLRRWIKLSSFASPGILPAIRLKAYRTALMNADDSQVRLLNA